MSITVTHPMLGLSKTGDYMIKADFTAELHCEGAGQVVVADASWYDPAMRLDDQGWLCAENDREDDELTSGQFLRIKFDFEYLRMERGSAGERAIYNIKCNNRWNYAGARLERNARGWLGLYGTGWTGRVTDAVTNLPLHLAGFGDYWKIETLRDWNGNVESADSIPFYLRDKHGHRVARAKSKDASVDLSLNQARFLNSGETPGEIVTFYLKNIQLAS